MDRRGRLRALGAAIGAVRALDHEGVEHALRDVGGRRRLLAPLAYGAGTVAVVFDGVLLLIRNWRLTLLQVIPAVWIWVMTWNLRTHLFADEQPPFERAAGIAIGVLVTAQIAYWCNATFASSLLQEGRASIRVAFRDTLPHWRLVGGLALLTGALQAAVWVVLPDVNLRWFWLALLVMFVVQVYLFVAVPAWIAGARPTGSRRERLLRSATTGVLSGVAAIPGFVFNRLGLLLMGVGPFLILGIVITAAGAVLHVTASSSVRVVKLSVRLRGDAPHTGGTPAA